MIRIHYIFFTIDIFPYPNKLASKYKNLCSFPCISRHSFYARLMALNYNSNLYIVSHFIRLLFYCMGIFSGLITLYCPLSPFSANYIATKHSERISLILLSNKFSGVVLIGRVECQVNCSCRLRRIVLSSIYHCGYKMVQ